MTSQISATWKSDKKKLKQIAQKVIKIQFDEEVTEIQSIVDFGEVNYTVFAKTNENTYVIRMNEKEELDRFEKEEWCIDVARKQGVLTPEVLFIGVVDNVAVSIFPYVEGVNGSTSAEKEKIWIQIGQYAKKIHQIQVDGYGENLVNSSTHKFRDSWERYVKYNIEALNLDDPLIENGTLTSEISQILKQKFTQLLRTPFQFGLCHGDLSEKNTLVAQNEEVWLIDWGSAEAQIVPHFDFIGVLDWSFGKTSDEFASFLEGYGMSKADFEKIYPETLDLSLLFTIDKVRWAIDRNSEKINYFTERLMGKLKNISV